MYYMCYGFFDSVTRSVKKIFLRLYTSQCELERECARGHFAETTFAVIRSLSLSKKLKNISREILENKGHLFSISKTSQEILREKCIRDSYRISILVICLKDCFYVKAVVNRIEASRRTKVDLENNSKHLQTLNEFWDNMMPDARTTLEGPVDWTAVGFQNKNPETDFRGMGILGLQQMMYLSKYEKSKADYILQVCNHHRRWLPMAATGINITAYLLELIDSRRCHRILIEALYHYQTKIQKCVIDSTNTSAYQNVYETINSDFIGNIYSSSQELLTEQPLGIDHDLMQVGIDTVHNEYCHIFFEFINFWADNDPTDIMQFQRLFTLFKRNIELDRYRNV